MRQPDVQGLNRNQPDSIALEYFCDAEDEEDETDGQCYDYDSDCDDEYHYPGCVDLRIGLEGDKDELQSERSDHEAVLLLLQIDNSDYYLRCGCVINKILKIPATTVW